tara:strand:+ start:3738 stop:3863 length:126 start_codon:yes stop_codon:yes gene_type:complete
MAKTRKLVKKIFDDIKFYVDYKRWERKKRKEAYPVEWFIEE